MLLIINFINWILHDKLGRNVHFDGVASKVVIGGSGVCVEVGCGAGVGVGGGRGGGFAVIVTMFVTVTIGG